MKYAVCVPYAYKPYFDDFIKTVKIPRQNMLLIDNTVDNIGIMRSHNKGIDFMNRLGADWLIVMSAAMRFGEPGGLDFIEHIEKHSDHHVINGAGRVRIDNTDRVQGIGWHLTAFRRDIFDNIGRWDENFTPYGFDDVDMTLRIKKYYGDSYKNGTFPCDCDHVSISHSVQLAGVVAPSTPRILYFVEKWGRHPGAWMWDGYEHPFNDKRKPLAYWPPATNGGYWDERTN